MIAIHPHKKSIWYYLFEGLFGAFQWISAKIQASRILRNLPISHFWWSVATVLIIIGLTLLYKRVTKARWKEALQFGVSLLIFRFLSFTPILNKLRHKKMFYLGQASVMDRTLATCYVWVWITALLAFIGLQIY